jgi:energy-coupling factor transporter ATP-binding protein EcfA2
VGAHYNVDAVSWFLPSAIRAAIGGGDEVRTYQRRGYLARGTEESAVVEKIRSLGDLRRVARIAEGEVSGRGILLASDHAMVCFVSSGKKMAVEFVTDADDVYAALSEALDKAIIKSGSESGTISALINTDHGFRIHDIGCVGVELQRDNYAPVVLAAFDHVVEDLKVKSPCGRLTVFSGEPGSGKSFLVRALVEAMSGTASLIVVPPHLVSQLGDPSLLPALISKREEDSGPIILICEDGDECLVRRGSDNMSSVQSVLNLGDGLLGSLLDIRLLVTTNAKKLEMDAAVEREGRLCRRLDVGRLDGAQADRVLGRLVPGTTSFREPVTLARVYAKARELGWKPDDAPIEPDEIDEIAEESAR